MFEQANWTGIAKFAIECFVVIGAFKLFTSICRSPIAATAVGGFVLAWIAAAAVTDPVIRIIPIFAGVGWIGAFIMAGYGRAATEADLAPDILDVSRDWTRWIVVGPLGAVLGVVGLLALSAILGPDGLDGFQLWQGPNFTWDDLNELRALHYPNLAEIFVFRVMLTMAWDGAVVALPIAMILAPVLGVTSLVRRVRTGQWTT